MRGIGCLEQLTRCYQILVRRLRDKRITNDASFCIRKQTLSKIHS
jgi:hypothetical protein